MDYFKVPYIAYVILIICVVVISFFKTSSEQQTHFAHTSQEKLRRKFQHYQSVTDFTSYRSSRDSNYACIFYFDYYVNSP